MSRNGRFVSFNSLVTTTVWRPWLRTSEVNRVPKMASAEKP